MDHQDWPGWPEDDPHFESADNVDPADLGGHDGGFDQLGHEGLGHDALGHDVLGSDVLGDDGLGHDPMGHEAATSSPDLAPELGDDGADGAPAGHGHFAAAGDVYPDDDPFTAGHHDGTGPVVHDDVADVAPDHDPDHDNPDPVPDDHQLVDHLVGADPDLDPRADWPDPAFPPPLDLHGSPEPIDGYPWSDPQVLGSGRTDTGIDGYHEAGWQHPSIGDLYDYAGEEPAPGTDGWQGLLGSDDPATSALARWWAPGT
jgi:hypothetical protein